MTEGEVRALLLSAALVVAGAVGRAFLQVPEGRPELVGLDPAGSPDSALVVAESLHAERARRSEPLGPGQKLDPNSASEVEIDRLPGVGPTRARAIVEHRKRHGPFRTVGDLERVPGLGPTTVQRLAPYVSLPPGPATSDRPGVGGSAAGRSAGVGPGAAAGAVASARRRVDLNRASASELERLPGIGPGRSSAIVGWREEHGGFRAIDDLLRVPGIGPATLEKLRDLVVVGP